MSSAEDDGASVQPTDLASATLAGLNISTIEEREVHLRSQFYHTYLRPHEGRRHSARMIISIARRKYFPSLSQSQVIDSREILNEESMTEGKFMNLLKRIELKLTLAVDRKTFQPIPPEAWVIYMTANALDEKKAYFSHLEGMNQRVKEMCMSGNNAPLRPISDYKSCLHNSTFREVIKLDVDTKEEQHLDQLKETLRSSSIKVSYALESRGGYHVLVPCKQQLKNLWLLGKELTKTLGVKDTWLTVETINGSPQLAIPGTTQGAWLVRPTTLFDEFLL